MHPHERQDPPRDPNDIPGTSAGLYTGLGIAALAVIALIAFTSTPEVPPPGADTAANSEPVEPVTPNTPPPVRTE